VAVEADLSDTHTHTQSRDWWNQSKKAKAVYQDGWSYKVKIANLYIH